MEKKSYALFLKETNNPKLLNDLLSKFIDFFSDFCTVEIIILEKKSYKNPRVRKAKGLDRWLY